VVQAQAKVATSFAFPLLTSHLEQLIQRLELCWRQSKQNLRHQTREDGLTLILLILTAEWANFSSLVDSPATRWVGNQPAVHGQLLLEQQWGTTKVLDPVTHHHCVWYVGVDLSVSNGLKSPQCLVMYPSPQCLFFQEAS
jgi:hypothetical protein